MTPLAISVGDPAGIGAEIVAAALADSETATRAWIFGDLRRVEVLLRARGVRDFVLPARVWPGGLADARLGLLDHGGVPDDAPRAPSAAGGRAQIAALNAAVDAVIEGAASALVTGPTSKEAAALAKIDFVGQTEHLARRVGLADDAVTMMFLGPKLRVALVTTHVSIAALPGALTQARVRRTITHLAQALERLGGERRRVRIDVCGLNPHASEAGLFGDEEARIIAPAIEEARRDPALSAARVEILGPRPAEAVFRAAAAKETDGVVAMFHDQATIPSKLLDFGDAVNVTWGLPFVRTSVDHGVAYDLAGTGRARPDGMIAAIRMALRLGGRT